MSEYKDEPDESDEPDEPKTDAHLTPEGRASEKVAELRMHSELAAIFEGPRKFDAQVLAGLDPDVARDVQRSMARFERAKVDPTPVIEPAAMSEAQRILTLPETNDALATGDYHVYRRPGEVMMVRWLAGDAECGTFIARYQAHCDAALAGARDDERSSLEWRGDAQTTAYLDALDAATLPAAELYYRDPIVKHGLCVITTTVTDEMNIRFLCSHLMGVEVPAVIGDRNVPGDGAPDRELAWFFKLFSLRGLVDGIERMCFFAFLQKSEDDLEF